MASWIVPVTAFSLVCAVAQTPEPRKDASAYPAHAVMKAGLIGAENLGHGILMPDGVIATNDYLVIEVALYSSAATVDVAASHFALRVNGQSTLVPPDSPGSVAASLKYSDWGRTPSEVIVGAGDAHVILGGGHAEPRFPGDPRAAGRGAPNPVPRVPTRASPVEKELEEPVDYTVKRCSLPEGSLRPPVSGYLYFPYKHKLKTVKKLELTYDGPLGTATLKLK